MEALSATINWMDGKKQRVSCSYRSYRETTTSSYTMTKESLIPTIIGSRSGYAIRFTCPSCKNENSILYNMPKPYYKETREANCKRCRTRYTIYVPDENSRNILNQV
ncbi:MAG: hypothetical protein MUF37_07650 [Methanoregulaceae archaeon]|nr:hypothetical protein [Methanoregulaceae archaeon]